MYVWFGSAFPSHVAFVGESILAYHSCPPVHGPMHVTTSVTPPVVTTESSADGDCPPGASIFCQHGWPLPQRPLPPSGRVRMPPSVPARM